MTARPERGFALIAAIFVLIVVAGLGIRIATLGGVQHSTVRMSVQGERAHFAARAGVEWAIQDIVANAAANLACGAGPVSFSLTDAALAGYDVSVTCTVLPVTEGAASYSLYNLSVRATHGSFGSVGFASRQLVAVIAV